jgi:hypothetical protein
MPIKILSSLHYHFYRGPSLLPNPQLTVSSHFHLRSFYNLFKKLKDYVVPSIMADLYKDPLLFLSSFLNNWNK